MSPIANDEITGWHADLAAEALDGAAWQAQAAARFLTRGNYGAAIAAYDRMAVLVREYAASSMRVVRQYEVSAQVGSKEEGAREASA